jgi:hypothetical protein
LDSICNIVSSGDLDTSILCTATKQRSSVGRSQSGDPGSRLIPLSGTVECNEFTFVAGILLHIGQAFQDRLQLDN